MARSKEARIIGIRPLVASHWSVPFIDSRFRTVIGEKGSIQMRRAGLSALIRLGVAQANVVHCD